MHFLQSLSWTVFSWVAVIGVVITIHELGHFLAAKAVGTKIDLFSIGFGKALASWRDKSGVEWRLGWMPIGGYVRFAGDDNASSIPTAEELTDMRRQLAAEGRGHEINRYFHFKPIWQRAVIILAGPVANFLLAIAIFAAFFMTFGEVATPAKVSAVAPNSAAAAAGFRPGDTVLEMAGQKVRSFEELSQQVQFRGGVPTTFVVERDGQRVTLLATPTWAWEEDQVNGKRRIGRLGIARPTAPDAQVRIHYSPPEAVAMGVRHTWNIITTSVYYLGRMLTGQVSADQLRGPLGIATVAGKVAQAGAAFGPDLSDKVEGVILSLIELVALISTSVGFMNLLPVPVLDGGHLLFLACEAVARRPLAAKVQAAGYRVGLALVLGLMLFATWNDVQRLHVFKLFNRLVS
jgi:regulator of sigma E protease